jgi:hypothetical protein
MKETRDIERDLYKSDITTIEIQEVRRDENRNFVPIGEKKIVLKLDKDQYISIGRSRGGYGEERYPSIPIRTTTERKIYVDPVYVRVVDKRYRGAEFPVRTERLSIMGRYGVVSDDEISDAMSRYQAEIRTIGIAGEEQYVVVIKNVGKAGQEIKIYDENGNKIGSIPFEGELIVRKGTYYIELPGTYLLRDRDQAEKNGLLKITFS